jgi:hypothetical protein
MMLWAVTHKAYFDGAMLPKVIVSMASPGTSTFEMRSSDRGIVELDMTQTMKVLKGRHVGSGGGTCADGIVVSASQEDGVYAVLCAQSMQSPEEPARVCAVVMDPTGPDRHVEGSIEVRVLPGYAQCGQHVVEATFAPDARLCFGVTLQRRLAALLLGAVVVGLVAGIWLRRRARRA